MTLMPIFNDSISLLSEKRPNEPLFIFLSMSIIQSLFSAIGVIASIFFIITVSFNQSIQTVSNILTCNSSLAVLILASDVLAVAAYILYRDLSPGKVEMKNMFLCQLRGYLMHISFCALIYSFVIQAFYRLAGIVFYERLYYQSLRPYLYAVMVQWTIPFLEIVPIIITNNQEFIEEEYLCQILISKTSVFIYMCTVAYFIPLTLIMIQYSIIGRYSRRETIGAHPINIQQRARRQMKLIRRILILIFILLMLGTPYCTIIVLNALTLVPAPRYAHRFGFLFIGISAGCIMLMMIYFTPNLRRLFFGKKKYRKDRTLKSNYLEQQTKGRTRWFREVAPSETALNDHPLI